MTVYQNISQLVEKGIKTGLIDRQDTVYVRNQLLGLLKLEDFQEEGGESEESIPELVELLVCYAAEKEIIADILDEKEILAAKLMDCFVPLPSQVTDEFWRRYEKSAAEATDYFYNLSKNNNYIQTKRIAKNIHFQADSEYGKLDITINLSKPEKDPRQIKREREKKENIAYPECLLCRENEGYPGRTGYPARSNHRVIPIDFADEKWFFQYSPYVYYNEHSILLTEEHRPMKITRATFERLTTFATMFPHYFIGSNADLPIVGGSILSHDHFQGGKYEFAMDKAEAIRTFSLSRFPSVEASIVKWPLSVIRLRSDKREELVKASDFIFEKWKTYSDDQAGIKAFTADEPHNTVTPITRRRGKRYEMDLVLRNNRTSEEHPLGIFHPHADVHHIKKENIGLIEVMGLAVLPPRLETELKEIRKYLLGEPADVAAYHQEWAEEMKKNKASISSVNVDKIIEQGLGEKFSRVLEDAGVFKQTESGLEAFKRFIDHIS